MRREGKLSGLATALGVSQAKLDAALQKIHPDRGERHDDIAAKLAAKLGVSTATVESAFEALHRRGAAKEDLAKAIGVSQAKLDAAFKSLKDEFGKQQDRREGDFAA